MKAVLTLGLILLMSTGALAQKEPKHVKAKYSKVDLVLDARPVVVVFDKQIQRTDQTQVARLYRFKHARIRAELSFQTQKQHLTV